MSKERKGRVKMRFLDDKGKVFGVINIFDLLAVILILSIVTPAALFQYKSFNKARTAAKLSVSEVEPPNYHHVYKNIKIKGYLVSEVAGYIEKGKRALTENGNVFWEITDVRVEPVRIEASTGQGDALVKAGVHAQESKDYQVLMGDGSKDKLVECTSRKSDDMVELLGIKLVTISLMAQCRIERDGRVILSLDNHLLRRGNPVTLSTESYNITLVIKDYD